MSQDNLIKLAKPGAFCDAPSEVFRKAAESRIVVNTHRINQGEMPEWPKRGDNSGSFLV
ncbi:MAG: hypothetical protein WBF43_06270 [Methylocella sp.]